jgi:hypothetical protein
MIMGIVNYPEFKDTNIDEELHYFARRHENLVISRIFVFNYTFEPGSLPIQKPRSDPDSLVVFPPEGLCEGGSMVRILQNISNMHLNASRLYRQVAVHLKEVMSHASVRILESLERQTRICEDARAKSTIPAGVQLSTLHDEIELTNDNDIPSQSSRSVSTNIPWTTRKQTAVKKRLHERLRKWMGDLCLQVCSPIDALEHYSASINEARVTGKSISAGDLLWLAGALEGFISAMLLLHKLNLPVEEILSRELRVLMLNQNNLTEEEPPSLAAKVMMLMEERAVEALSLYSRNIIFCAFEVECSLRLARAQEFNTTLEKERKVLEYVMRAASVPGLNSQQQIECVLEGGLICRRMGLNRKYALLLFVAAVMSADCENAQLAYALMRKACRQYGIFIPSESISRSRHRIQPYSESSAASYCSNDEEIGIFVQDPKASWASMRRSVFGYAANAAKQCLDNAVAIRFISALLRLMLHVEDTNVNLFSAWLPVFEQYLTAEAQRHQLPTAGAYASTSSEEFKPVSNHRVMSFFGVDGASGNPVDLDESRHGGHPAARSNPAQQSSATHPNPTLQYSAAPSYGDHASLPAPGTRRAGRFSIASLKEFDVASSNINSSRMLSTGGILPGTSTMSSLSNQSILQPTGSFMPSAIFGQQHSSPPIVSGATNIPHNYGDLLAKKIMEGDPAGSIRDIVHDSAEVFRSGLRRISAPSLPPKLMSTVMDSGQRFRNGLNHTGSRHRPGIVPKKVTDDRVDSSLDSGTGINNGFLASSGYNNQFHAEYSRPDPYLSGLEETLRALQLMLDGASVPIEHQDQALSLLEDIARHVDPCWPVDLPILAETCRPCLLPLDGCRPVKLLAESAAACQIVAQRREIASTVTEDPNSTDAPFATIPVKKSGALFYDPFAAQRAKDVKERTVAEVIWAVATVGSVMLVINNPLAVPLTFDSLSLVCEGVPYIAYERSAVIPPYHNTFEITLSVKPLETGTLICTALKVFVNNAVHLINLSSNGACIKKYGSEIASPWAFPYSAALTAQQSSKSTGASSSSGKSPSSKTTFSSTNNLHEILDSSVGIETTSITVVSEGVQIKLVPGWLDLRASGQQTLVCRSGFSRCYGLEDNSTPLYLLPLLQGEVRRARIHVVENMVSERRSRGELGISHFKIIVTQFSRRTGKAQSFVLKNFGNGFADTCSEGNLAKSCCCGLISFPDFTSSASLGGKSSADIVLEFNSNTPNIADIDYIRIDLEILQATDTDFDTIARTDVDEKSVSIFCRRYVL